MLKNTTTARPPKGKKDKAKQNRRISLHLVRRGIVINRDFVSGRNRVRQKGIVCQRKRGPICCGRLREGQNEKSAMFNAMTTAWGPIAGRVRRESQKGGFRADGAPTGALIKTASQAVSTLPVGRRHLEEVVLLQVGQSEGHSSFPMRSR